MRKIKLKPKKKSGFFRLLIKNYIGFTFIVILLIVVFVIVLIFINDTILKSPKVDVLVGQTSLLKAGKYDTLSEKKLLGDRGYFEIADKDGQVIFSSSGTVNIYSKEEIEYIQNYYENSWNSVYEFEAGSEENPEKRIVIRREIHDVGAVENSSDFAFYMDSNLYSSVYEVSDGQLNKGSITILDDDLNVIYSSVSTEKLSYTERDLIYLNGYGPDDFQIQRYEFTGDDGSQYNMIIHTEDIGNDKYSKIDRISIFFMILFIVLYVLLLIVFVLLIHLKVKKPLDILNRAILEFTDGKRDGNVEYTGPAEFMKICESFNSMRARLADSEQAHEILEEDKRKMLADISHDLKTPVTVIQGYSKAIYDGMVSGEKKDYYLKTIYQKSNALTELINTFYEYSKVEHPDFNLVLEKTDICEYVREYLAAKYEEIDMANLTLEVNVPEEQVWCEVDRVQLKRVFENIIGNSIKHSINGTTIFFNLEVSEEKIKIVIADDGAGISETIGKNVFEPFVVGDESRTTKQGSGLGLAVCKRIIVAHGGTIDVIIPNHRGSGSEFKIILDRLIL